MLLVEKPLAFQTVAAPARSPTRPPKQGKVLGGRVGEWAGAETNENVLGWPLKANLVIGVMHEPF
jgi:hypothetical protein